MSYEKLPPPLEWAKSMLDSLRPPDGQPLTQYETEKVHQDECPRCHGSLDTGWECNKCGYDAYWIAEIIYGLGS